MTWKCLWTSALVAAATLGSATGAWAQIVRVAADVPAAGYGWTDADPTDPVSTPNDPTPAKRPPIGQGLNELASPSPSDLPPPPVEPAEPYAVPGCDAGYSAGPSCDGSYAGPSCGADYSDAYCPTSCCCNLWTFRAEAVLLQRGQPEDVALYTPTVGVGYNAQDYVFNYAGGARLTAIRNNVWDSCWDLEVAWLGVHGFHDQLAGVTTGTYLTTPVINIAAAGTITTDYFARIDSGEVNFRRRAYDNVTWLVGFRWFEAAEDLNTDISVGPTFHRVDVNNHLYGIQVGADAILWDRGGPWTFNGIAKMGVYGNTADVTTTTNAPGAIAFLQVGDNQTAFVAELGLNGVYQITPQLSGRIGYNLLWLDGVASAPSQLATTDIVTGIATVNFSDTQFYHGLSFGIDYVW